jgi:hypothetical protein
MVRQGVAGEMALAACAPRLLLSLLEERDRTALHTELLYSLAQPIDDKGISNY